MRTPIGLALAVLGTLAIAASLGPLVAASAPSASPAANTSTAEASAIGATASATAGTAASSATTAAPPQPPSALADGWRVTVPRLAIDLPLRDGDLSRDIADQSTPINAAFRLPGSPAPGARGNLYVYAHARAGMFLSLWSAKVGDSVMLVSPGGVALTYVVTEVAPRVPINDIRYLVPTEDERLTLQTSTGPHVGDPRFVVVAMPQRR